MAEALLRASLDEREIPGVSVASIGLLFDGRPAEPGAVAAMTKRGLDITGHRARTLTPEALDAADLLVAMEARHLYELAEAGVGSDRAFTLPDLVVRAEQIGRRGDDETETAWVSRLSLGRPADGWITSNSAMEVADPMGGSRRRFRQCAEVLADLVDRFVAVAWPVAATDLPDARNDTETWSPT
jgi:protein-tyrosine-phosphatase